MLANQRRDKILKLLREDGSAKVIKLAKIFKVSEVTIRQDLERLESDGYIRREHGGAFLKNVEDSVKSFTLLNQDNLEKKKLIGRKAAELIEAGGTIILGAEPGIEVIVTGGEFKPPTLSLTGQKAATFFEDIHGDKLFLPTAGISLRSGLTYPSLSDIVVKNHDRVG